MPGHTRLPVKVCNASGDASHDASRPNSRASAALRLTQYGSLSGRNGWGVEKSVPSRAKRFRQTNGVVACGLAGAAKGWVENICKVMFGLSLT